MTPARRPLARRRGRHSARDAEAEIERDYSRLEAEILKTVRAKLSAAGAPIDDGALAASYNEAWHALYAARVGGRQIENRVGFLVQVTYRRALDEQRAALRGGSVATVAGDEGAVEHDLEGQLDDRLRVRALMQGMRERLDGRELRAAALCYVHGYTRPEAARELGVRPRRFEKVMDSVSKELSGLVGDLRAGEWCDSRRSLISAYALGVLDSDGERYRLAVAHLEDCSACRRRVLCMRGLAGIVPPAPMLLATLPGAGGAGAAVAERGGSWLARANGHWAEIGAGGAAVAAATSAFVIVGPPGDKASPPPAAPAVAAAPLPASSSPALRAAAARSAARARAAVRRRTAKRRPVAQRRDAPVTQAPPAQQPADPVAPATPAPSPSPAPTTSPPPSSAAPADDGWEEFELRR